MKLTHSTVSVAAALMQRPDGVHWGYELSREAGVTAGTMYPLLTRMLDAGWLEDGWEDEESVQGRPARRYYRLTEAGLVELGALLNKAAQDRRFASRPKLRPVRRRLRPGIAGGST